MKRKEVVKLLRRFINKIDVKPIIKLSKKLTVFKDDVIFKWSTEARSYLENKFKSNKEQIVVHVDEVFHTVESVMRHLKKTMCDELENYDVKVFGEYRNLCVKDLEVILTNYEIDYKVIEELCSYNLCNNRVFKPEEIFILKEEKKVNNMEAMYNKLLTGKIEVVGGSYILK